MKSESELEWIDKNQARVHWVLKEGIEFAYGWYIVDNFSVESTTPQPFPHANELADFEFTFQKRQTEIFWERDIDQDSSYKGMFLNIKNPKTNQRKLFSIWVRSAWEAVSEIEITQYDLLIAKIHL